MALLYGPGPDPLWSLSILYGPPVWSWARPPLVPLHLVWPSCMVLGPTPSGPSPSCMALLYGPGPDPLWSLSILYGPPVWSWARPPLVPLRLVWPSCIVLGPTPSGPSPSCVALLYGPGPDPHLVTLRLVWPSCMVLGPTSCK